MKKDTISFEKLRQQFTVYNKTVGKSARTIDWYEQKLDLFERYLGPDACLADVTIQNVRGYIAELQERTERNPNNPHSRLDGPGTARSSALRPGLGTVPSHEWATGRAAIMLPRVLTGGSRTRDALSARKGAGLSGGAAS